MVKRQEIFSFRVFVFRVKVLCKLNGMMLMPFCQVGREVCNTIPEGGNGGG
jgi:hypothetical protein